MDDRGSILAMLFFLSVWNVVTYFMAVRGVSPVPTAADPRSIRNTGRVFLAVGLLLLGLSIYELATGTFRWRGHERTYGFADLIRLGAEHDAPFH